MHRRDASNKRDTIKSRSFNSMGTRNSRDSRKGREHWDANVSKNLLGDASKSREWIPATERRPSKDASKDTGTSAIKVIVWREIIDLTGKKRHKFCIASVAVQ
jgi:hypothetical protein